MKGKKCGELVSGTKSLGLWLLVAGWECTDPEASRGRSGPSLDTAQDTALGITQDKQKWPTYPHLGSQMASQPLLRR